MFRAARDRFSAANIATAALDARLLSAAAFSLSELSFVVAEKDIAPSAGVQRLDGFVERRLKGEPVARILGEKAFYGLDFGLSAATLVPRPETELVVDLALSMLPVSPGLMLDLGTGTGCIPIAILNARPLLHAVAVDVSAAALETAAENARRHGVAARLAFHAGSWFAPLAPDVMFDLIVSNPPYIEQADIVGLAVDVQHFDPALALDGGSDGLDAYRAIAAQARQRLNPGGGAIVEFGFGQASGVAEIFTAAGFQTLEVHADLAGHDRVLVAR